PGQGHSWNQPEEVEPSPPALTILSFPANGVLKIGRDMNSQLRTDNPMVSRQQAELFLASADELKIAVHDLHSSNGTSVEKANGTRFRLMGNQNEILTRGDVVKLGGSLSIVNKIPEDLP